MQCCRIQFFLRDVPSDVQGMHAVDPFRGGRPLLALPRTGLRDRDPNPIHCSFCSFGERVFWSREDRRRGRGRRRKTSCGGGDCRLKLRPFLLFQSWSWFGLHPTDFRLRLKKSLTGLFRCRESVLFGIGWRR